MLRTSIKKQKKQKIPVYERDVLSPTKLSTCFFNSSSPKILDIGFGNGITLLEKARKDPKTLYLGTEVYKRGILLLRHAIARQEAMYPMHPISNIFVCQYDAIQLLFSYCPPAIFEQIHIHFPDPWPKTKHIKRRMITFEFLQLCAIVLKASGFLHILTDHNQYSEFITHSFAAYTGDVSAVEEWAKTFMTSRKSVQGNLYRLCVNARLQRDNPRRLHNTWKKIPTHQHPNYIEISTVNSNYHNKGLREGRTIHSHLYQKIQEH